MRIHPFRSWLATSALILFAAVYLTGCASAATPYAAATEAPPASEAEETEAAAATEAPIATEAPAGTEAIYPTQGLPAPTQQATSPTVEPYFEQRIIELEWPENIRLGESDIIRLALIPSEDGYTAKAEYEEHDILNQDVAIKRPDGYVLTGIARLDGVGFEISPTGNQEIVLPPDEIVTWRWSLTPRMTGQQRLSIILLLHWQPDSTTGGQVAESLIFDRNLDIHVRSLLGLRTSEALKIGFTGILLSAVLGTWALTDRRKVKRKGLRVVTPASSLSIETKSEMRLNEEEKILLQSLFSKYRRILLKEEFLSGYSGARTFLAQPVNLNGQSDAETIIKIGRRADIEMEYCHYEEFVKNRLPPITARIQHIPVTAPSLKKAALQYTCISDPRKSPTSLRQTLLSSPNADYFKQLFDNFGPYWWMQRHPYTFRLAQEYDRLLPPHLVLEPATGQPGKLLDQKVDADTQKFEVGEIVSVSSFSQWEYRADNQSITLFGEPQEGKPTFRIRWLSNQPPKNATARIVSNRMDLLRQATREFDLLGLPDPLPRLNTWLQEVVQGTRSIIHGDLNLENILVGPGNLVWLIDFAQTREGHPLYDFAHLGSEVIAHILSQRGMSGREFVALLQNKADPLLNSIEQISTNCLFNPADAREYRMSMILSCLGGLKYKNVSEGGKYFLYLAAAYYGSQE